MKAHEFLTEGIYQVGDQLKDTLNEKVYELTGVSNWKGHKSFTLFDVKSQGLGMWTRGDGSRYKEPSQIHILREDWVYFKDHKKYKTVTDHFGSSEAAIKWAFEQLQQMPDAKEIGAISGEMGSDEFADAIIMKNTIFVNRGRQITMQSKSVLRNLAIWRQK